MDEPHDAQRLAAVTRFLGAAEFVRAFTLCAIGTAFLARTNSGVAGWPALITVVAALVMLALAVLLVRRRDLEWRGILTISLIAFVGWCAVSLFWSDYQWSTLGGILYQIGFTILGVAVALLRDLIQIVRAFGDVLRVLLVISLALEVFSGLLIDAPIPFLGITGGLATAGPIEGLFGTRNQLGLVALLALIAFVVEALTRSVRRGLSVGSLILGSLVIVLTQSPVALGTVLILGLASLALFGLRRLSTENKRIGEILLLVTLVVGLAIAWAARSSIITALNAGSEFEYRYLIWRRILDAITLNPVEGFGWIGAWRTDVPPYLILAQGLRGGETPSAYNAYLDVLLQTGLVGLALLIGFLGLALTRSWVLAANKRSVVYVWPALTLVALLVVSSVESMILIEAGWLVVVVCAVKASEGLSWRRGLIDSLRTD